MTEETCEYPDCKLPAIIVWSKKHYCEFHFRVKRRSRSNRLRTIAKAKLQEMGVVKNV